MKKLIFLDIDNVIIIDNKPIDKNIIDELNKLNAEIVICSSWGDLGKNFLESLGITLPIIGSTKHFYNTLICRGCEVKNWIDTNINENEDYDYALVDDCEDYLIEQEKYLVHVNYKTGLTIEDVNKIKTILSERM